MMPGPDRLQLLLNQSVLTGIDFVYVHPDQVTLDVFFLRNPETLTTPLVDDVDASQVLIYSTSASSLPTVPVMVDSWPVVDARRVLRLIAASPGDFTLYRLRINDARIDRYFNDVLFSFKANCPSDLDCEPPPPECPLEEVVDFPVDYQARDFWSFRRALLDFAALRYPDWMDRLEADAGVMLVEVMSALGDELAYYQDRVAREAYLETASQRRSLRRHARLVDYMVHDGLGASTWLDITCATGQSGVLPAGADVWALSDSNLQVSFEVGRGLADVLAGKTFAVDAARNSFDPHIWDEDDACLKVGTTEVFIKGHHAADLPFDDFPAGAAAGKWALLRTDPADPSVEARRWLVRLVQVENLSDPLINDPVTGHDITHLVWEAEQALPFEMDMAFLTVRGNLLPATAGKTEQKRFTIGPSSDPADRPEAVEREGPDGAVTYLFSLPESDKRGLVWLGEEPSGADPEIHLEEVELIGGVWTTDEVWLWRRSLLGTNSSKPNDYHFTLDDGMWERVVGYQRIGAEIEHIDYASGSGFTVRFGDGEFGRIPAQGAVFQVTYRLGNGRAGNLPADSITNFDPSFTFIASVTNPLAAENGLDPETPAEVRQLAPEAYQAVTFRAVRPEDYAEAAERLEWVQRAGAAFRWTGSWLSAFVTPDPLGAVTLSQDRRVELAHQLDRFRQAGREAHVSDPVYADIDLIINICVEPYAFKGEIEELVLEALLGKKGLRPRVGFFSADHFTFGTPLERSALEAAIQAVPGVRAVEGMQIRRRGWFDWRSFDELVYQVGDNVVIRLENDPLYPERGSLRLDMEGGA